MKKTMLILAVFLLIGSLAYADEVLPSGITLKQGMVYDWGSKHTKNLTTFEVMKTKADPSFGKWNMLWEGWSIDAFAAYDSSSINSGGILIGREFGKLGDYLPIDFPLKKFVQITIYPIGLYVDNIPNEPKFSACSGGSFVKLSVSF